MHLVIPGIFKKSRHTAIKAGWILALGAAFLYALFTVPIRILSVTTTNVFVFLPAVGLADFIFTDYHTWAKINIKGHLIAGLG